VGGGGLADVEEFYDFDDKEGIIVNKRFGQRAFILGVRQWTSLIEKLYNTFGSAAEVILFEIGKSYGRSALEQEKEIDSDRELTINLLSREAIVAGWGKVTLKQESQRDYTVKAQRCVFCSGSTDPSHRQVGCFFLKGVISGFAEILFNLRNEVKETYCGKDYCEFKVKLS
jgi:predicted hydrocarbon binding protein